MQVSAAGLNTPRFNLVLDRLRHEIELGRFQQDDMLPGERDLATVMDVSRTTLRRMLASLVEAGLLRHRQGVGTFIVRQPSRAAQALPGGPAPTAPDLVRLPGFADEMRMRGFTPSSRLLAGSQAMPTPDEVMMLACAPRTPILRVSRLRYGDDVPMAVDVTVVPRRYIPHVEAIGGSLYATLDAKGHRPVRALNQIQATLVSRRDAAILEVPEASAGLLVRRTTYLDDGQCCDFTRSTYPAGRYDLIVEHLGHDPMINGHSQTRQPLSPVTDR